MTRGSGGGRRPNDEGERNGKRKSPVVSERGGGGERIRSSNK